MKRALPVFILSSLCVLAFAACPGTNWQAALDGYNLRLPQPDASLGFANGRSCGANVDCQSGQCRSGQCIEDVPVGNGPISCGDDDDCGSEPRDGGRVCEPASVAGAGAYTCTPFTACGKTGRVCREASDCFSPTGGCGAGCIDGICKVLTCGREEADAGCSVQSDCCTGYFCSGPVDGGVLAAGTGRCLTSAPNILPADALCTAADQCQSKYCNTATTRSCTNNMLTTGKLGEGCPCLSGLVCDNGRCLIADRGGCVLDSSCKSGQCLAGFCTPKTDSVSQARVCRQLDLVCGDDNDCCTGLCDAREKQCSLNPRLLDGSSCAVDPNTQKCVGEVTCVGAHGSCLDGPCCNGMTCTNGTCF